MEYKMQIALESTVFFPLKEHYEKKVKVSEPVRQAINALSPVALSLFQMMSLRGKICLRDSLDAYFCTIA